MTTPEKLTLRQLLTVFMRSGHPGCNDVHDTLAGR